MKVLIVEDETVAYENLVAILSGIDASIEVTGNTESIRQTLQWLKVNSAPDLILMDIHLSDGSAFTIFQHTVVETPIIFTTAYDEYAIDAFKVNSIDYLLKPVKEEEIERALAKFRKWTRAETVEYLAQMSRLSFPGRYKDKLLVPVKDKLLPVDLKDVSCFYTTDKSTCIYLKDGSSYPYSKTLEQILSNLNPEEFIRANKQFIIARDSIRHISVWLDNRLLVQLDVETPEKVYVSKNRAAGFKGWMVR